VFSRSVNEAVYVEQLARRSIDYTPGQQQLSGHAHTLTFPLSYSGCQNGSDGAIRPDVTRNRKEPARWITSSIYTVRCKGSGQSKMAAINQKGILMNLFPTLRTRELGHKSILNNAWRMRSHRTISNNERVTHFGAFENHKHTIGMRDTARVSVTLMKFTIVLTIWTKTENMLINLLNTYWF